MQSTIKLASDNILYNIKDAVDLQTSLVLDNIMTDIEMIWVESALNTTRLRYVSMTTVSIGYPGYCHILGTMYAFARAATHTHTHRHPHTHTHVQTDADRRKRAQLT